MTTSQPQRGAIGVLLLIVFFDMLAFGIIIPFTPFWAEKFGASPFEVTLLFSTYSLFAFVSSFPWGVISDKWGRRPILCFSMLGTALSFAWVSQADALWMLFAARAFGGLMGGTLPVAQAYIADVTQPEDRAGRMGLMGAAIGAGFVLGPGVGWLLTRAGAGETDFRTAFMIAAAVGLVGFLAALFVLNEPPARIRNDETRSVAGRMRSFSVAAATPGVLFPLLILTVLAFCMAGLESTFALWTERQLQWGVREVSIFFLFIGFLMVVVQGGVVRPVSKRFGEGPLVVIGSLLMSIGFAAVLIVYSPPMAFIGGTLIAVGFGLANPSLSALISRNAPDEHQGAAMGASQSTQSLCRILGPLAFGAAFDGLNRNAPYLGGAVLLFIGFLIAIKALNYVKRSQSG
ncbi:MAG: MFS transporter [Pseudomonadota bacterium]|nr:MFS transporter [Pseudomonadota bacterium]